MKNLLSLLLGMCLTASTYASSNQVLISVGKDSSDAEWARENCDLIHQAVNISSAGNISSNCSWNEKNDFVNNKVRKQLDSTEYLFHIDFRELKNRNKILRIVNLQPQDDTDIKQFVWTIEGKDKDWKIKLSKLIKQAFDYQTNREVLKLSYLAQGIKESNEVAQRSDGAFVDKLSGEEITGEEAYNRFKDETPKQKKYLRAALELAGVLGFSALNYQIQRESMARDWDFPTLRSAWDSKFSSGKGYRFDDNARRVNEGHSYAGMVYYMVARASGYSSMESLLINTAASCVWEFIIEYREVVSLNDQVLTPLGGFAIGEAYHQIAKIFRKNKNSTVNKVLSTIFDTPTGMNNWIDKRYGNGPREIEDFDTDFFSKFDIETSIVKNSHRNGLDGRVKFDAQVINIGSMEEVGNVNKLITDTVFSQILYSIPVNRSSAMENFNFSVKNILAAYYKKSLRQDSNGNLEGYNFIIGPSNGVDFIEENSKFNKSVKEDWMSIVNVLGSSMRLDMYVGGFKVSTTIDLFADFAMVRSYSIDSYKQQNPTAKLSSVIDTFNYYYGYGSTKSVGLKISKGRFEIGGKATDHSYKSFNSKYRDQDTVDQNLKFNDSTSTAEVYVSYRMTDDLTAKLSYEKTVRNGGIQGFGFFEGTTTRASGTLVYNFR